ncbi:MAG: hypothetical protein ACLUSP_00760 [Christensenellales bacterium]
MESDENGKKMRGFGKHVHVDKPAGGTLEEFEEMLDLAKEKDLTVQLGYMYRYNFALQKCIKMIKSGELRNISDRRRNEYVSLKRVQTVA